MRNLPFMSSTERLSGDLRGSNCGIFSVVSLGYFGFFAPVFSAQPETFQNDSQIQY